MEGNNLNFNFRQVFGESLPLDQIQSCDIISCVSFDETGSFLAVGDNGGRVIIFFKMKDAQKEAVSFGFCAEFQAHQSKFDYLKSEQVSERIVGIKWVPRTSNGFRILTCNERCIKLWHIILQPQNLYSASNSAEFQSKYQLKFPQFKSQFQQPRARLIRTYQTYAVQCINNLQLLNCKDAFIVSDDTSVHKWSTETDTAAQILIQLTDEKEFVTCCCAAEGERVVVGTTTGRVFVHHCLSRQTHIVPYSPVMGQPSLPYGIFQQLGAPAEAIQSITVRGDMAYIRDLLGIRILNIESQVLLHIAPLHPYLSKNYVEVAKMCLLDKSATVNYQNFVVTGSYADRFILIDSQNQAIAIQTTRQAKRRSAQIVQYLTQKKKISPCQNVGAMVVHDGNCLFEEEMYFDGVDYKKKVLALDWAGGVLAVANYNNLYVYQTFQ